MKHASVWVLVASLALPVVAQERGAPIFQDSFDTAATFAENWVVGKGWAGRVNSGEGKVLFAQGGQLSMRRDTPEDFCAEMDVTVNARLPGAKSLFCGFDVEGFFFTIIPDGAFWLASSPKGNSATRISSKIDDFQLGKPVKLALIRKVENGIAQYVCRIDGREMAVVRFSPPAMKDGKYGPVSIFSVGLDMTVDNFALFALKSGGESPNLVINSGFEYAQDGFPPYLIRCFTGDITKIRDYEADYLAKWSLDTGDKHGGNQSMRITKDEFSTSVSALFGGVGTVEGGAGVFSIWMKADRDNFPVTISYAKSRQVLVAREWTRYEVVNPKLPKPGVYSPVSLSFKENGTLWLDDLQAEFITAPGEEELKTDKTFASPYNPSELDKTRFGKELTVAVIRTPEITVPELPAGVAPGEDLDAWKNYAVKLDRFYVSENTPTAKTEAYLACDKENFYVGCRSFVNDLSKVNTDTLKHDTVIFSRDAAEVLVDPLAGEGKFKYYQFFAYPGGARADKGLGLDTSWDGNWKSQVKLNEKDNCIDYVLRIPFSDFSNPEMKEQWVMNLHRYDAATGQASTLIKCLKPSFASREYWPLVNLPAEVVRPYAVGVASGGYSNNSVSLDFVNNSGKERRVTAEVTDAGHNSQKLDIALRPGASNVSFRLAVNDPKVIVKLTENNVPLCCQTIILEKRNPVRMLGRLNYYMNEAEAPFRVTAALPDVAHMTAVLTCGKVSARCPAAPKFTLVLPLQEIADGTHNVVLKLEKDGQTVAQTSADLVKRPYREGVTQLNRFSRSLIHDGKNVFMFAPLQELNAGVTKEYAAAKNAFLAKNGFKTLMILSTNKTRQSGKHFFDAAMRNGMLVHFWSKYDAMGEEDLNSFIQEFDYPNIVANLILDEPEISSTPSAAAKEFMLKMRKKLPYQPCNINYTVIGIPARYADLETDILGLDDYLSNAEGRSVESVLRNVDIAWKAGEADGKPVWIFLVDGNSVHHPRGEISFGEQVAQCYGCVAIGCTGLEFYNGNVSTLPNWRAFVRSNRELQSLADVLCSEEECEEVACDAINTAEAKLRHRTKKLNGELYVISVNTGTERMEKVTFTLPAGLQYAGDAEVLFEDRKLPLKEGKFSDAFPGHSRHVYKVKVK